MRTRASIPALNLLTALLLALPAAAVPLAAAQASEGGGVSTTTSTMSEEDLRRAIQAARERLRRRAPPPPPLPSAVYDAYEFRYHLLGNAECMSYAQQADAVLGDPALKDDDRVKPLQAIGAAARRAGCVADSGN